MQKVNSSFEDQSCNQLGVPGRNEHMQLHIEEVLRYAGCAVMAPVTIMIRLQKVS